MHTEGSGDSDVLNENKVHENGGIVNEMQFSVLEIPRIARRLLIEFLLKNRRNHGRASC